MNVIDKKIHAYDTTTFVYFDIETIPTQDDAVKADILANLKAPANYKKPESIEAWKAENGPAQIEKTSFDAASGHVCTIAWAKNEGEIFADHAETVEQEKQIITNFFSRLDQYHSEKFCGHNLAGFDIPFLTRRAIILGIEIPQSFPRNPKPWDAKVHDTMFMWDSKNFMSMDALCKAMKIDGKEGFDGSMVAKAWSDGEHEKIQDYCADDVYRTREIHKRFLAAGW